MIIKMNLILGVALMLVKVSLITANDNVYTVYQLIDALKNDDYVAVSDLSKKVNDAEHPQRFNEVIYQVLKHDYVKINLEKMVKYFATHNNKSERIHGYTAIFNELRNRNELYRGVLANLAFGLKDLLRQDLSTEVRDAGRQLKETLPKSIRNLAFAKEVCIVDIKKNAFLTVGEPMGGFVDMYYNRRKVHAWTSLPINSVYERFWIIEPYEDAFHIRSYARNNEYLYAGGSYQIEDGNRNVFTWIPGGYENDVGEYQWIFEAYGDFTRIKNRYAEEYLLFSNLSWEYERVFTRPRTNEYLHHVWKIDDCSQKG